MEETDGHILRRWVSMGDVLVMLTSLSVFAFGYGRLSSDVEALGVAMNEMRSQDITPGARASIERLLAKDITQDAQIQEIRIEMRDQRREILESLSRVEDKLDDHDRGRPR